MYGLKAQKEQYRDYTLGSLKPSVVVHTSNAGARKAEAGQSPVQGQHELHSNNASRNKHKQFTKKEPGSFPTRTPACHQALPHPFFRAAQTYANQTQNTQAAQRPWSDQKPAQPGG